MRKLGKLPPRHDARALHLSTYAQDCPSPPSKWDWARSVHVPWGVMLNDQIGDCAIAGMGHALMVWSAAAATVVTPKDVDIERAYEAVGHYNPGNPATDNGVVLLDALKYWRNWGIAGHKIIAWVDVNPANAIHVKQAVWLFGVGYIGLALPSSCEDQIGGLWDFAGDGRTGADEPGSWGGHCIDIVAYDDSGLTAITWGAPQRMTWRWFARYCDEFHVPVSPDWMISGPHGPISASGFDLSALQADLLAVAQA